MFRKRRTIDRTALLETLGRELAKEHARQLKQGSVKAKQLAARELPRNGQDSKAHHDAVRAPYAAFLHRVEELLQTSVDRPAGAVETQLAESATQDIDREIGKLEHQKGVQQIDADQQVGPISPPVAAFVSVLITSIAFLGEAYWASDGFQVTGATPREAFYVALAYAMGMAGFLHIAVVIIQFIRRRFWKVVVALLCLGTALAGFWVVGAMRAKFLQLAEDTQDLLVAPWMFAAVSMAMFIGLGAISWRFMPSWDEITLWWQRRQARRRIRRIERQIARLRDKREAVPQDLAEQTEGRARITRGAQALRARTSELHREAHHHLVHETSLRRRTDPPVEFLAEPVDLLNTPS